MISQEKLLAFYILVQCAREGRSKARIKPSVIRKMLDQSRLSYKMMVELKSSLAPFFLGIELRDNNEVLLKVVNEDGFLKHHKKGVTKGPLITSDDTETVSSWETVKGWASSVGLID